MPAVLDTHAAIWYLLDSRHLPQTVFALIDGAVASGTPTYISAVSLVLRDANSRNEFAVSGHDFSRAATGVCRRRL